MKLMTELPLEFKGLKQAVKKLYYKGDLSLLNRPKIAIIGSRKMSVYTKGCVLELASCLKNAGFCVVSGGALGVDITAHMGAMPCTIGIFANGLNQIYPKSNEKIIRQIYTDALALSENEGEYMPRREDFLLRNRLIIALCEHIIIAQADMKSGSLHSANLALRLGKRVYTLPQRVGESDGTNELLAQGKIKLISDFKGFARALASSLNLEADFKEVCEEEDEILAFCKRGVSLNEALKKFKDKIYEYELDGKLEIQGVMVKTKI